MGQVAFRFGLVLSVVGEVELLDVFDAGLFAGGHGRIGEVFDQADLAGVASAVGELDPLVLVVFVLFNLNKLDIRRI